MRSSVDRIPSRSQVEVQVKIGRKKERGSSAGAGKPHPPGRVKIVDALKALLEQKDFGAVTTAEIARTAGVTEALIYKYFRDKRDLLHQVLGEYLEQYFLQFQTDMKGVQGALNKLRKLIWGHLNVYSTHRVFARILLLEVRNYPDYYRSETYEQVKRYSKVLLEIIEEGVTAGEIREDLSPKFIRQVILGSMEHVCLTGIIFQREITPDELTEDLCRVVFQGIERRR
jgi:TetR/AcrR family transcriptional regulator, fatty acid metabolism regulator protein